MEYRVEVENSVSEIEIFVESSDKECKIEGAGKHTLALGENKIHVKVSAKDLTERIYILTIIRAKRHDNYLLSLVATTENYTHTIEPEFDKNTRLYTLTVENNVQTVVVGATPEEETSTVEGIGEIGLKQRRQYNCNYSNCRKWFEKRV